MSSPPVRIAVEGCGHGKLHAIYASVKEASARKGWPDGPDLLIIGGDFQAVRNSHDLNAMSVPKKYRAMGDFHEYYSGQRLAPYLTLFVGGNHEASNYLFELYYGGWCAPNIYYLGAANVIRFGPLRIAALSGIWKGFDYRKQHHERLPYKVDDVKSAYHVREIDVRKLLQIRTQVDIGLSHDWPRGVEWLGKWQQLFACKRGFEGDAREDKLGSAAAKYVLDRLRPAYWFSAHLHVKYSAVVEHREPESAAIEQTERYGEIAPFDAVGVVDSVNHERPGEEITLEPTKNKDEIDVELSDDDEQTGNFTSSNSKSTAVTNGISAELRAQLPSTFSQPTPTKPQSQPIEHPPSITNKQTRFLALDKCLPGRHFLQLLEVSPSEPSSVTNKSFALTYDREWLAICRALASELVIGDRSAVVPPAKSFAEYAAAIDAEQAWVDEHIVQKNLLAVPHNFEKLAPAYDPADGLNPPSQPQEYPNPQTSAFCELLGIENKFEQTEAQRERRLEGFGKRLTGDGGESERGGGRRGGRGSGRARGRGGRGDGRGRGRGGFRPY